MFATFSPSALAEGILFVESFSPTYIGHGVAFGAAYIDWRDKVHTAFQQLSGMRPFEMSTDELATWKILEDAIDVVAYRNSTPITLLEIGEVSFERRQTPQAVRWKHGRKERVSLDQMPAAFAALRPGQCFEAVVEREPLTGDLLRSTYVKPIATVRPLSGPQLQAFWESLNDTRDVAETEPFDGNSDG